jgi:MoaA/NifB/PqqE/SkfB family radical SAM enzyme
MKIINTLATWHWHIEISSKCALKCPRCARQEVSNTLINTELTLEFFKIHFTPEFIMHNVEKISFCGDDGDPIYARDLIEIIRYIKSVKPVEFVIITNGSYKSVNWWKSLGQVLTSIDEVHFSIDGWDQSSNEQYRINCDWDSIMLGLDTLRKNSDVFITWAAIAFSFNQNYLDYMQMLATNTGCDTFQITKSTKFNKIYPSYPIGDILQPDVNLISNTGRFERIIYPLSNRTKIVKSFLTNVILYKKIKLKFNNSETIPLCAIGNKGLYISSTGKLYPCCWVANRYSHNSEWQNLSIDLHKTLLVDAVNNEFWQNEFKNFTWLECRTKCNSRVVNYNYATEW